MTKITNIVPITFCGASGGNFLSWFLHLAQDNNMELIVLSKWGNAHSNPYNYSSTKNRIYIDDSIIIDDVIKNHPFVDKIWFPQIHIQNIKLLSEKFHRAIRITFNNEDIDNIVKLVIGKVYIDIKQTSETNIKHYIKFEKDNYTKQLNFFNNTIVCDNVLNIPFKDLLYTPEDKLIENLSNFLGINLENFNKTNLIAWRDKTLACIESMNKYFS